MRGRLQPNVREAAHSRARGTEEDLRRVGSSTGRSTGPGGFGADEAESGLGRASHIDVEFLWVQRALADGLVTVEKVDTEINTSDLMTKNLSGARVQKLMGLLGFRYLDGLSPLAPRSG